MIAAAMDEDSKHGEQQPETVTQLRQQLVTAQQAAKHNAEQAILSGAQLITWKQKTQLLMGVIEQMQEWHRQYNKCDKPETECEWCAEAREIIDAINKADEADRASGIRIKAP